MWKSNIPQKISYNYLGTKSCSIFMLTNYSNLNEGNYFFIINITYNLLNFFNKFKKT